MFFWNTSLLLLSFTVSLRHPGALGQDKIDKCCAKGEIISIGENLKCAPQDITTELHSIKRRNDVTHINECFENGNVTNLSDIINENIKRIKASSACIDFLHDKVEFGVIPIIVHCQAHNDSDSSLEIPKIARFRVCCRRNEIYDIQSRECISKEFGELDTADYISSVINNHSLVEFTSFVRGPPNCQHVIVNHVIDSKRDLQILRNGSIRVLIPSDGDKSAVLLTEENSCLDGDDLSVFTTVRLCTGPEYCQRNSCVKKCCPEGQMRINKVCQMILPNMTSDEFHQELEKFALESVNSTATWKPFNIDNYGIIVGTPFCEEGMYALQPNDSRGIDFKGHVHAFGDVHEEFNHHQYCMEFIHDTMGYEDGFYPGVCFPVPKEPGQLRFGINAALELTSCMFLLITFLVYVFLPVLQNLHGKTLMCHVASLFLAYGCLAATGLIETLDTDTDPLYENLRCKFVGYTMLFSFLAAFSWLNVMCFDIWWTFGGLGRAANMGGRRQTQRKRFSLYSLYAWGLAFILTCLSVTADYTEFIEEHLRPNIGTATCWFQRSSENHGGIIFFIGPISLQLVANIVFFILTSLYCNRVKAEITRVMMPASDPKSRRFHSAKSKFILNIKLFIVMGISWIMEIISTFLNSYATDLHWRIEFFYISDAFNCLQGLLIFILFVLKSKVYHALKSKLNNRKINTPGNLTATLQDPYKVRKSVSCSTLMSNFAVNVAP